MHGVCTRTIDQWVQKKTEGHSWASYHKISACTVRNKRSQFSSLLSKAFTDGILVHTPFTFDARKDNAVTFDIDLDEDIVSSKLLPLGQVSCPSYYAEYGSIQDEWDGIVQRDKKR